MEEKGVGAGKGSVSYLLLSPNHVRSVGVWPYSGERYAAGLHRGYLEGQ